jgi:Zn-dependent M28 family amino/carboxypeptidase
MAQSPEPVQRAVQLSQSALEQRLAYEIVESLTTEVGPRLAGTDAEARAREWAVAMLQELGFSNVRIDSFELPVWERGLEQARITAPFPQPLVITTLGGSAATGPEGIEAEVIAVADVATLQATPEQLLEGRIVFVDEVMTRTQDGSGYSIAVAKRRKAAYVAHAKGAAAVLIRSVGTSGHRFAHTGQMRPVIDQEGNPGVPAAALSAPDADQLRRVLARHGSARIHLVLTPQTRPKGVSGNVIAEIPGRTSPHEIVLVGAHLDSWDQGTGAVDDGAGVGIVVAAARHLSEFEPDGPARTIRVVLFGAEEVGLAGARAYAEKYAEQLDDHIVATESDFGAGRIWRFDTGVAEERVAAARSLGAPLRGLGVAQGDNNAYGGPDMKFIREAGVPVVGLKQNGWDYFDLHHTPDDTLDKIDPQALAQNVAAYAAYLYMAANSGEYYR